MNLQQLLDSPALKPVLDLIPDGILLVDPAGTIRAVNAGVVSLLGYSEGELLGQPVEMLVPMSARAHHAQWRERYGERPHVRPMGENPGLVGVHKDGSRVPVDIKLSPTRVDGQAWVTAVLRDVSHIRDMQAELESYATELERTNRALEATLERLATQNEALDLLNRQKSELLGVAAHDLRNPLAAIRGFAQFIKLEEEEGGDAPHNRRVAERIMRGADYMLGLVDDLLDLAAIESGQLRLRLQTVDLAALTEEVVQLERVSAQRKGISIRLVVEGCTRPASVDPRKIEQVVHNLVGNAVKFSPVGSKVVVRLRQIADAGHEIAVCDEGPGIPEDERLALFEPFQRGSRRPTAGERSTGLGLAIARRIVEGHGGDIGVESEVGGGSSFVVRLPGVAA